MAALRLPVTPPANAASSTDISRVAMVKATRVSISVKPRWPEHCPSKRTPVRRRKRDKIEESRAASDSIRAEPALAGGQRRAIIEEYSAGHPIHQHIVVLAVFDQTDAASGRTAIRKEADRTDVIVAALLRDGEQDQTNSFRQTVRRTGRIDPIEASLNVDD